MTPTFIANAKFFTRPAPKMFIISVVANSVVEVRIDRTSLTRNLDLLERKGLVRRVAAPGNARLCEVTEAGEQLLVDLIEEWKLAQAELMSELNADDAAAFLRVAKHMTTV